MKWAQETKNCELGFNENRLNLGIGRFFNDHHVNDNSFSNRLNKHKTNLAVNGTMDTGCSLG